MKRNDQKTRMLAGLVVGLGSLWATASIAAEIPLAGGYNHLPVVGASDYIPLAGVYGTPHACALYLAGGGWSVYKDILPDGSYLPGPEAGKRPLNLLITPEMFVAFEIACDVYSVAGKEVTFRCTGGHTGDWEWVATVVENKTRKTLEYIYADGTDVLQLCEPPPVSRLYNPPESCAETQRDSG